MMTSRPRKPERKKPSGPKPPDKFAQYPIALGPEDGFFLPVVLTGAPGEEMTWELWHWMQQRKRPPGWLPSATTASGLPVVPAAASQAEPAMRSPGMITRIAHAAGLAVLLRSNSEARAEALSSPFAFARAIADMATVLGLTEADAPLDPASRSVRNIAETFIESWRLTH
jgi:hypothetical protein